MNPGDDEEEAETATTKGCFANFGTTYRSDGARESGRCRGLFWLGITIEPEFELEASLPSGDIADAGFLHRRWWSGWWGSGYGLDEDDVEMREWHGGGFATPLSEEGRTPLVRKASGVNGKEMAMPSCWGWIDDQVAAVASIMAQRWDGGVGEEPESGLLMIFKPQEGGMEDEWNETASL